MSLAAARACSRVASRIALSHNVTRTLATEAVPDPTSDPPTDYAFRPLEKKRQQHPLVFVRAWDSIRNMPELLAMLRGVEKKFGRVKDFRVVRDYDISSTYMSFFKVDFADEDAYKLIPEQGTNIKVEVPVVNTDRPGGIGIADIACLLEPQDRDLNMKTEGLYGAPIVVLPEDGVMMKTRVVELIVQLAKTDRSEWVNTRREGSRVVFGTAFYEWGGFYKPDAEDAPPVPATMTAALRRWSRHARQQGHLRSSRQRRTACSASASLVVEDVRPTGSDSTNADAGSSKNMFDAVKGTSDPRAPASAAAVDSSVTTLAGGPDPISADVPVASSPAHVSQVPRLSRKEKILELARRHARTPVSEGRAAEEELKAKPEVRQTSVRERLLKLIGGW